MSKRLQYGWAQAWAWCQCRAVHRPDITAAEVSPGCSLGQQLLPARGTVCTATWTKLPVHWQTGGSGKEPLPQRPVPCAQSEALMLALQWRALNIVKHRDATTHLIAWLKYSTEGLDLLSHQQVNDSPSAQHRDGQQPSRAESLRSPRTCKPYGSPSVACTGAVGSPLGTSPTL